MMNSIHSQNNHSRKRNRSSFSFEASSSIVAPMLRYLVFASLPFLVRGQFYFCTPLSNETWAGLVEAISESYRLAVLCPFKISGDGCPSIDEYPEGLVLGHGSDDVMIIECDPDFNVPFQEGKTKSRCIIDCPGRHFSVGPSSRGLILTNMILSGATNSSIYVEENGRLDVVNVLFEKYVSKEGNHQYVFE